MTPAERRKVIRAIAEFLSPLDEHEVDSYLRAAGSPEITPSGWGTETDGQIRQLGLMAILRSVSDDVLGELLEFIPEAERPAISRELDSKPQSKRGIKHTADRPIFVVHGHAHAVLYEAVRVLEHGTGREVIVLHEQANAGRTILEKFEDHAVGASFAVVLLTGDDEGGARASTGKRLRGRQNVIFELGFFFGKLGRERVVVLLEESIEKPSDIDGLTYIELDKAGAWKQALARELEAAGILVDRSRIP